VLEGKLEGKCTHGKPRIMMLDCIMPGLDLSFWTLRNKCIGHRAAILFTTYA